MSHFTSDRALFATMLGAFLLMAGLATADLVSDVRDGITTGHALAEGAILLVGFAGAGLAARKLIATTRLARGATAQVQSLAKQLKATEAEAARWRGEARELMLGLGRAIDEQFDRWQLSPAEKEVGLLLLKGLSHKEIAQIRSVTAATARQQARALYRKAGLSGRHDLAAFFLEDLMLPMIDGRADDTDGDRASPPRP